MKSIALFVFMLLAALSPANAQADMTGMWVSDFYGNRVECHLEQRGEFLYGVAYVFTRAGERNTYHLAGLYLDNTIRALHGSGNSFIGALQGDDKAAGTFFFKDGPSFAMQAERVKRGKTFPGGLEWPPGYPPTK